jgi:DNA repair exonuclease SbcCD nuclease subunit
LHIGNAGIDNKSNLNDIRDKFDVTINDICNRIKDKKLEKIYLVPLGDILHYDTPTRTTTAGTNLESTELDFATIFNMGAEMLIGGIDKLLQIAPIEIPYISGNHDRTLGYALIKSIQFYYRNNQSVTVDCDILPRKFRKIGKSLVGWAHGDLAKDKVGSWLQTEARKEWGDTCFSEVHVGHFHTQQTVTEKNGTIVRYLPSITDIDMWTYERGFVGAVKSTVSFVWDKDTGLKEMWFSNI